MASLYKKPVIVTDPKTGQKIKTKSKKWWGRYRDENGVERRVPLAVDKAAAQAMLKELVKKVERRAVLAWMVKDGRTDRNPLAHMSGMNAKVDVRREQRSLPPNEFALFLEAAPTGKPKRKLSGEDRAMLYLLAANSGFRCSELASLTPESFCLIGDSPSVTVEVAYSKRRREDTQPLARDVATVLANWLSGKPPKKHLWPGG